MRIRMVSGPLFLPEMNGRQLLQRYADDVMNCNKTENIAGAVFAQAERYPDRPAFLGLMNLSFKELAAAVASFAGIIENEIPDTGALITLSFRDDCLELVALLACALAGRRCTAVSRRTTPSVWARQVEYVQGELILCEDDIPVPEGYKILRIEWSDLKNLVACGIPDKAAGQDAPFILVTSSGSTGTPKAFYLSQSMLMQRILQRIRFFQITPDDVFLRVSSMSYIGSKVRALAALSAGAGVAIPRNQDPRELISSLHEHRVTFISAIVLQADQILSLMRSENASVKNGIRVLELSASSVPQEFRERIMKGLTANIYITYSTNESGAISIATPEEIAVFPGTVGKVLDDVDVRIVDKNGEPLPVGSTGLICVKTGQMISNYLDGSLNSSRHFAGGYFVTGDIGYIDAHAQLVHLGRADDLMIVNGVNIYPAEIEAQIRTYPGILDVKAVAFRHPVMQSLPVCLVTLKAGTSFREDELSRFAMEKLGNKAPRKFLVLDEIPRNEMGKIDWNALVVKIRELHGEKNPG